MPGTWPCGGGGHVRRSDVHVARRWHWTMLNERCRNAMPQRRQCERTGRARPAPRQAGRGPTHVRCAPVQAAALSPEARAACRQPMQPWSAAQPRQGDQEGRWLHRRPLPPKPVLADDQQARHLKQQERAGAAAAGRCVRVAHALLRRAVAAPAAAAHDGAAAQAQRRLAGLLAACRAGVASHRQVPGLTGVLEGRGWRGAG